MNEEQADDPRLTPAQRRVLENLLRGLTEKEVAARLNISIHTVHSHVKNLYKIFGVSSRGELIAQHRDKLVSSEATNDTTAPEESGLADDSPIAGPLSVYVDEDAFTSDEKGELLSLISSMYHLQSKDRLVIDSTGTAEVTPATVGPKGGGHQ